MEKTKQQTSFEKIDKQLDIIKEQRGLTTNEKRAWLDSLSNHLRTARSIPYVEHKWVVRVSERDLKDYPHIFNRTKTSLQKCWTEMNSSKEKYKQDIQDMEFICKIKFGIQTRWEVVIYTIVDGETVKGETIDEINEQNDNHEQTDC